MKKLYLLVFTLLAGLWVYGQEGFNYKILITQNNTPLANQPVILRLTLKDGGTSVYTETQNVTTDANGIASVVIGTGNSPDYFENIDWSHSITLQTEVSTDGGANFTDFGTTALQFVPYAKYAENTPTSNLFLDLMGNPATEYNETITHNGMLFLGELFTPDGTPPQSELESYQSNDASAKISALAGFVNGTGSGTHFGLYTQNLGNGSGSQYGAYHYMNTQGNGANYGVSVRNVGNGDGTHYGFYSIIAGSGNGDQYGVYNINVNTGSGTHYGVYNNFHGFGMGSQYGVYNDMIDESADVTGVKNQITANGDNWAMGVWNDITVNGAAAIGIDNNITHNGGMISFGTLNNIQADSSAIWLVAADNEIHGNGDGDRYATINYISGTGYGDKYGTYNVIDSTSGGTHYAVYGEAEKTGSYAGYFKGDVYVSKKLKSNVAGDADLKPYIYGWIGSDGSIETRGSTSGFTAVSSGTGNYTITFDNEMPDRYSYIVVVTPTNAVNPVLFGVWPMEDHFSVYFWNTDGNSVDQSFYFVVYKK